MMMMMMMIQYNTTIQYNTMFNVVITLSYGFDASRRYGDDKMQSNRCCRSIVPPFYYNSTFAFFTTRATI